MSWLVWPSAWLPFWAGLHVFAVGLSLAGLRAVGCPKKSISALREVYSGLSLSKRVYLRRLLRSQVYYVLATLAGIALLCGGAGFPWGAFWLLDRATHPEDTMLLGTRGRGSGFMTAAFSAALAHWLLALMEDWGSWQYLAQQPGMDGRMKFKEWEKRFLNGGVLFVYTAHHITAVLAFGYCLATGELAATCCTGLLFEAPVCFTNVREFAVTFDTELRHALGSSLMSLAGLRGVRIWWRCVTATLLLGRFSGIAVFIWSEAFWGQRLEELPVQTRKAYTFLGAFFSVLTIVWCFQLLVWWDQDNFLLEQQSPVSGKTPAWELVGSPANASVDAESPVEFEAQVPEGGATAKY